MTRKEDLQRQIEEELDKGFDNLLKKDAFLAEVNLEDLENSNGERLEYWLALVRAARECSRLVGVRQQNRHDAERTANGNRRIINNS